ncbi:NAD(P)-binding Rossmann-fold superfamily protein isoform 2 [Gossypium australe]|uniref:NAD(P)-binding Rossmann-fold superfamily protein isoform 2 n=1 Tax=Gossypium australe TaxID=47621 RepID=A0A5B6VJL1_9ROSI|nr:NAD(P)-binding Rossmann-fold superfamily protein isoform 2 [Gossypium australe]
MTTSFRAFPAVTAPPLPSLAPTASFPARSPSLPQRRIFFILKKIENFLPTFQPMMLFSVYFQHDCSLCKFGVKCSYAEAGISDDSRSATIDVVANIRNERIVVLGGSGFVGSAICKAAVSKGIEVISLSRSGRPTYSGSWVDQVNWVPGMFSFP